MSAYKLLPFFTRKIELENLNQNSVLATVKTKQKTSETNKAKYKFTLLKCRSKVKSQRNIKIE